MNEAKRDELLLDIHKMLGEMNTKLNADYRALHGNGQKGLIDKHNDLEKQVQRIEDAQQPSNKELDDKHDALEKRVTKLENLHLVNDKNKSSIITWIGLLLTAAGTIYAIIKHH